MDNKKHRFVSEDVLKAELPLFFKPTLSKSEIEMVIDKVEEDLILRKAREIELNRANKSFKGVF